MQVPTVVGFGRRLCAAVVLTVLLEVAVLGSLEFEGRSFLICPAASYHNNRYMIQLVVVFVINRYLFVRARVWRLARVLALFVA